MKHLFESWRKYIKETQAPQKLLKEFNRKDKESLMDMENRFSVSYEIELESDESFGYDSYGESRYDMDRVRGALNEDYFYESIVERDAEDGLVADGNSIDDYEELAMHFLEEEEGISDPQENNTEALYAIIAFEKDPDYYKDFVDLLSSGLSPNAPLNPAMTSALLTLLVRGSLEFRNAPEDKEAEILKNMGLEIFEDTQTNLPFPEGEEPPTIYRSGNLAQFVNKYLYNLSSDAPYEVEGFTSFDRRFGICSLLEEFEIEVKKLNSKEYRHDSLGETLLSDAESILEAIMQGGMSRWPTIRDLIDSNEYSADTSPVSDSIESMVSSLAEQYVEKNAEAEYEDFLEDPVEYLENMGLDMSEYEAEPEDSDYMTLLYTHLPNFMHEYADQLKFEEDASLSNGVEFSMDTPLYMTGLEEAFNFLELFFTDLDNQTNFRFDSNTGLHTNIGFLSDEDLPEPNLIKGLLLLNDKFARKGFENRGNSRWARDLKAATKEYLGKHTHPDFTQKELMKSLTGGASGPQLKDLEKMLTSEVLSAARGVGAKALGMNVLYIKGSEYVEFRYPGNIDPTYDKMVDATLYYSHIVRSIYDENYKRKSYVKKLFGFISNLGEYSEDTTENVKRLKGIISAGVGTIYSGALQRSSGASLAEIEELYTDIGEAYSWDSQETFRRVLSHMGPGYSARKRNFPLIYGGLRRVGKSKTKKDYVVVFYRPISSQAEKPSQSVKFKVHTFSIEEMINGKVNDFSLIDGEFIMANKVDKEKRDKAMDMMGLSTDPGHLKNMPSNNEALFKIFSDWKQAFYKWRASNENYIEKRKGVFE